MLEMIANWRKKEEGKRSCDMRRCCEWRNKNMGNFSMLCSPPSFCPSPPLLSPSFSLFLSPTRTRHVRQNALACKLPDSARAMMVWYRCWMLIGRKPGSLTWAWSGKREREGGRGKREGVREKKKCVYFKAHEITQK